MKCLIMHKKMVHNQQEKTYLQNCLVVVIPKLMEKVIQNEHGVFIFSHAIFPDLQVQGITISFVQEHLERAIVRQLRGQSPKHVDYVLRLLVV